MWIWIENFRPFDLVTRAEFGTALSRMLFGLEDWTDSYYSTHLAKLKAEGEKIYGVPSRTRADLEAYGRKITLADLIDDELLEDTRLDKVTITSTRSGVSLRSHTGNILLSAPGTGPCSSLILDEDTDLKILCRTERGNVSVVAQYLLQDDSDVYEYADASEERTRMLIPDDRTMAGWAIHFSMNLLWTRSVKQISRLIE